jgi:hypothetical protein
VGLPTSICFNLAFTKCKLNKNINSSIFACCDMYLTNKNREMLISMRSDVSSMFNLDTKKSVSFINIV